jgi:hypothetical protein
MSLTRRLPSLSAAMVLAMLAGTFWSPDAEAQPRTLVSTASDGTPGAGSASAVAINANGRFVAFAMDAANLVTGDTNSSNDVFVKDRETNATTRVSVRSDGTERSGHSGSFGVDISDDGQIVVFTSVAALAADDTNECVSPGAPCQDIYVHNRGTGQTTRVSVATGRAQANQWSERPSISGDGRYVSFTSHASNLVSGDTNNAADIFLHDRQTQTTTRVSVNSSGGQGAAEHHSLQSQLNGDGSVVAFRSYAVLSDVPDPTPCTTFGPCVRAYVHVRATGATTRVPIAIPWPAGTIRTADPPTVHTVQIDTTGRWVSLLARNDTGTVYDPIWLSFYDRQTGKNTVFRQTVGEEGVHVMSGDGRMISASIRAANAAGGGETLRYDRVNGHLAITRGVNDLVLAMSFDGELGVTVGQSDANEAGVVLLDYDADNDQMDVTWETAFGLDPAVADGGGDVDNDGVSNLAEHEAGTHPNGVAKRYLAEGAVNAFFTTRIALFNPNDEPAIVSLRFLGTSGLLSSHVEPLRAHERKTVVLTPLANIPENDFSTVIESNRTVIADRTMTWDATTYGAHAETSLEAPSTTWYLAEGATHGWFSLFYLLQNPNDTDAQVTIDYLRLAPDTPVTKTYTVPKNSRMTLPVDDQAPELAAADLAARITSNVPIIAERAMYASLPGQPLASAGHGGAGVTSTALKWFLAEGATGSFFDLFVLVANPNADDSQLKVTYMFPTGEPLVKTYTAHANNRLTISVENEDPRLADTPVSIVVESTNNQPVVVERAMWWPGGGWYEAHLSAGTTTTGTKWALADGEINSNEGKETYILIANTSASPGTATVRFYLEGNISPLSPVLNWPIVLTVPLEPNSRTNVPIGLAPRLNFHRFSTIVDSDVPIVVERAMYQTTNGLTWSIGTSAVATKLQ